MTVAFKASNRAVAADPIGRNFPSFVRIDSIGEGATAKPMYVTRFNQLAPRPNRAVYTGKITGPPRDDFRKTETIQC